MKVILLCAMILAALIFIALITMLLGAFLVILISPLITVFGGN